MAIVDDEAGFILLMVLPGKGDDEGCSYTLMTSEVESK